MLIFCLVERPVIDAEGALDMAVTLMKTLHSPCWHPFHLNLSPSTHPVCSSISMKFLHLAIFVIVLVTGALAVPHPNASLTMRQLERSSKTTKSDASNWFQDPGILHAEDARGSVPAWEFATHDGKQVVGFPSHIHGPSARTRVMKELCECWRDKGRWTDMIAHADGRTKYEDGRNYAFMMERSACVDRRQAPLGPDTPLFGSRIPPGTSTQSPNSLISPLTLFDIFDGARRLLEARHGRPDASRVDPGTSSAFGEQ
ncbi:predicted protein [Postia placenta Mad-698-R]|nr:predicted protein [Postia placenta Mad-698-R]